MVTKNIQIRPVGSGDYADVLHPETNTDMVIDKATGKTVADLFSLEEPIEAVLNLGWKHVGGIYPPLTFYKDDFGVVHIQGVASCPGNTGDFMTLPVGYRPEKTEMLPSTAYISGKDEPVVIRVNPTSGGVQVYMAAGTVYASGSFRAR